MQLFEKQKHKPGINLTPLIDILFILIIFFVVSSRIIGESGVGLVLPESQQGKSTALTFPVLSMDEKLQFWLNDVLVTSQELPTALQKALQGTPSKTLILNIDKRVPHGKVLALMDQTKTTGFRKIVFGTRTPQQR
ncbi:biopolymer transporter ExbD [Deltaproteobacteria bacterium TL4]